ncbi:uncharacterized protein (DUF305 family) [Stackebrandtia albiflava]|uniref:Uncharacterized protein (DUF305 family) n=1 Tax=Stackebrandtia albiflava TaxID=406432 RepID=A0A562V1V3_9ACTN|nr:DUF305 domain-containing protein [Stackebrandtia albiflava]TWJ11879.1 uncharacterized protein (DUF305 family) [Stackebrandtia albiflava]
MRRAISARPILSVVMAALVAVALGLSVGVMSTRENPPGADSPEAGFAWDMSLHHGQAVAMSMYLYDNGGDEALRTIAYDIGLTQQGQIGVMRTWLRDWNLPQSSTDEPMQWMTMPMDMGSWAKDGRIMPGMATQDELTELYSLTGLEADLLFCELMINHHVGGVHMAEGVLELTEDEEVRWLADAMVSGQQSEIDALTEIADRLRGTEGSAQTG